MFRAMNSFDRNSRVCKPAPWRYRFPASTNNQPDNVVPKVIRKNKQGIEIFDDLFDDDDNKSSETEDDSIAMLSVAGDQKTVRRVKRMSAFSAVKSSSSEDESSNNISAEKLDTNGRLIGRDEVFRIQAELKRRRERHSGPEGEKQLDFSLPRPVNKQLRKRLSFTPNNESPNNAIDSPNLTEIGINDAIPVGRKRISFNSARKSGSLSKPNEAAGPNRRQKSFHRSQLIENSLKICASNANSKQLDTGNEQTAQVRTKKTHKSPNGEEHRNKTLNFDLNEWHDGDFELPPEQLSYMLKSFYENVKPVKKRKSIHKNLLQIDQNQSPSEQKSRFNEWLGDISTDGQFPRLNRYAGSSYYGQGTIKTLDEVVDDGAVDEDIEDESLDGDYEERNEIELPKKKNGVTAEISSFHEGRGDGDAPSGYLDDEITTEVSKAKIATGKRLKSKNESVGKTNTNNRVNSAKTSRRNAVARNKKSSQPSRRNLRRKNKVIEERAVGEISPNNITDEQIVIHNEMSSSNGTDARKNPASKPTSPGKVTEKRVLGRGPPSKKSSLNKSQAKTNMKILPELDVNDGSDEHGLRRNLRLREISPNVDEEAKISPNVDEEEKISPNESNNNVNSGQSVEKRSSNEERNGLMKLLDKVGNKVERRSQCVRFAKSGYRRNNGVAKKKFAAGLIRGSSSAPGLQNDRTNSSSKSQRRKRGPRRSKQVQDPPSKKQLIIPEENEDENLRRSKRTRMPRLATWDWERPKYVVDSMGLFVIDSITSPIPDPHSKDFRRKRAAVKKTKKVTDPEHTDTKLCWGHTK